MKLSTFPVLRLCLAGGVLVAFASAGRADDAGVIRISKPRTAHSASAIQTTSFVDFADDTADNLAQFYDSVYGATWDSQSRTRAHFASFGNFKASRGDEFVCDNCPFEGGSWDCPHGRTRGCRHGFCRHGHHGGTCPVCGGCHGSGCGHDMLYYFKCKFGFLTPTGNGGAGSPWHGKYSRVYPQDVNYFDPRDGQLWAAQGYGVPMAVPLAPTVGHTYNYSWGVPASRLTPISHVAPR